MTATESDTSSPGTASLLSSLSRAAARNLATTTKSVPQTRGISSRWLLKPLEWKQVDGGTYRANRRLSHTVGDGRVAFAKAGSVVRVIPAELAELPPLRGYGDGGVLSELARRFVQVEFGPGDVLVGFGHRADQVVLIAHGKVAKSGPGAYGAETSLGVLKDGDHFGAQALLSADGISEFTAKAITGVTALTLSRQEFEDVLRSSESLRARLEHASEVGAAANDRGEAEIDIASGHAGEPLLPGTFVDYEGSPREYGLSIARTVLRVHTRVANLYNQPMDQAEQQLRLTIEALRERQEHELVDNPDFGLLHNADFAQRVTTRTGEENRGVVGLPDEYEPGLSVRRMGVSDRAITSYLVSTYYSAAVLVPDAPAVLEGAEVSREG